MAKISYREKRTAYDGMKGVQYFEPDLEMLKAKKPDHELCKRKYVSAEKHQPEALWALLDDVHKDEIVTNRRRWFSKKEKQEINARLKECTGLVKKVKTAKTDEEARALMITLTQKIEELPEDVREQLDALDEAALLEEFENNQGKPLPDADDTEKTAEGTGEKNEEFENETEKEKAGEAEQQAGGDSDNSEKVDAETGKEEPDKKSTGTKPASKTGFKSQKKRVAKSKKRKSTRKSTGKTSKK